MKSGEIFFHCCWEKESDGTSTFCFPFELKMRDYVFKNISFFLRRHTDAEHKKKSNKFRKIQNESRIHSKKIRDLFLKHEKFH